MPRPIESFSGKNAIIGCAESHRTCRHNLHPESSYFSIDMDETINPDLLFDLRDELPSPLSGRFHITLLEHLPWTAYNDVPVGISKRLVGSKCGFENVWAMTQDDGFIIILGCPRQKEFRNSIQSLNYVEIPHEFLDYECVIIPKNQALSLQEINHAIQCDPDLIRIVTQLNEFNYIPQGQMFLFPDAPYADFPSHFNIAPSRKILTDAESANLHKHHQFAKVRNVYSAIEELKKWAEVNDVNERFNADKLRKLADNFFKHDTAIVRRDISIFQAKFKAFLQIVRKPSLETGLTYFLLILKLNQAIDMDSTSFVFQRSLLDLGMAFFQYTNVSEAHNSSTSSSQHQL